MCRKRFLGSQILKRNKLKLLAPKFKYCIEMNVSTLILYPSKNLIGLSHFEYVIKKEPLPTPKTGIDRGSWFVFRAFKQVPKSTLILALLLELCGEYNHTGRSFLIALRLAITGFFDP